MSWSRFRVHSLVLIGSIAATAGAEPPAALVEAARKEGTLVTLGCPTDWAGYGFVSEVMTKTHGMKWNDTNMPSIDEIERFASDPMESAADLADIGLQFGPMAAARDLLLPYKNTQWDTIPDWAKDPEGRYAACYYGTIAFLVNTKNVTTVPKTWQDLLKPEYKGLVSTQDPRAAANAQFAVIAAAFAHGGSENDLSPGIEYFARLRKSGNLTDVLADKDTLANGQAGIGLLWDFQGLAWRRDLPELEVLIPSDGSTFGPYAPIINKKARHPEAARLWIETMFSDEGQVAFARSGARPIRDVPLPQHISDGLLPEEQYDAARPIENWKAMGDIARTIGERWSSEVLGSAPAPAPAPAPAAKGP